MENKRSSADRRRIVFTRGLMGTLTLTRRLQPRWRVFSLSAHMWLGAGFRRAHAGSHFPMDVAAAYHQRRVELDKTAILAYAFQHYVALDFRVPCGWPSSSGSCNIPGSTIAHSHNNTTPTTADVLPEAVAAAKQVRVIPS